MIDHRANHRADHRAFVNPLACPGEIGIIETKSNIDKCLGTRLVYLVYWFW